MKRSIITLLVASCLISESMCMEQKKGLVHDTDTITIMEQTAYFIPTEALKNSGTLRNFCHDTQQNNFDISYLGQSASLSQETWNKVIMPALKDGENYTLSQNYSIKELLEITNAANFLDMPHLLKLASKKSAEYIIKNIGKLDEKNSNLLNLLRTELPEEMRQQIADFFTPALCTTIYSCATLSGHTSWPNSVVFGPGGKLLASCSFDHTIKLWDVESQKPLATLSRDEPFITSVVFSPDGTLLASCSVYATIKLWDLKSETPLLATLPGHTSCVNSVVFSPDSKLLASCSDDGTINLWDVKSKKLLATFSGHKDAVNSVVFSPDGKTLASCSNDKTIKLWDVESKTLLATFSGHKDAVRSVVFSPDGKTLASCANDNTIKLWDVKSKTLLATLSGHKDAVRSVIFSPDGTLLASCSADKTIKLWGVESKKLLATLLGHNDCVSSIAFSPDGKILASCAFDGTIKLWRIPDFSFEQKLLVLYVLQKARNEQQMYEPSDYDDLQKIYTTFDDTQKQRLALAIKEIKR